MADCPAKVGVPPKWWASGVPGYLSCVLEEGHEGQHVDPTGLSWEFMPYTVETVVPLEFTLEFLVGAHHPNCKCSTQPLEPRLPTVNTAVRLPGWWVAEQLEAVFGPVSPALFHPGP